MSNLSTGADTPAEVCLPRLSAWLEYTTAINCAASAYSSSSRQQFEAAKRIAKKRLLQPPASPARPIRRGPMRQHLIAILEAGLSVPDLVEVLSALPCIPALEEVIDMQPEQKQEWSRALSESAAEAGHLQVLQWHFNKGAFSANDAARSADIAAGAGNWDMLGWLLQRFSENFWFQTGSSWHSYALEHVFSHPEQQALFQLKSLDKVSDLSDLVQSEFCPSWYAAKAGYISSLQWIQDRWPACTGSSAAAQAAASSGHLDVLQWIRKQDTPWQWNEQVCYRAAASGHLDVLKWLKCQQPPCPFPEEPTAEELAMETAKQGHFHVLEWIIASETCSLLQVALFAAKHNCSRALAMLTAHHSLDNVPMNDRLASAAGKGSLETAKYLTPYLQVHDSSNAMFMALKSAIQRTTQLMTDPDVLAVIAWLWNRFDSFSRNQQATLSSLISCRRSPVPLELAAYGCKHVMPWTSSAFDHAVCNGGKKLLWWLLHECRSAHSREVPVGCSPGRTLLLVHGHGWSAPQPAMRRAAPTGSELLWQAVSRARDPVSGHPDWTFLGLSHPPSTAVGFRISSNSYLAHAEQLFYAFYGAAHIQRLLQRSSAGLGSLPQVLLKKIACSADIDFSWTFASE